MIDFRAELVKFPHLHILADLFTKDKAKVEYKAKKKLYDKMCKEFLDACHEMTSARVYKIKDRKRYAKQHFIANFEPIKYTERFEKVYSSMDNQDLSKLIEQERNEYTNRLNNPIEIKRYPYSRRRPRPPIPPQYINIQSGRLNKSFRCGMDAKGDKLDIVVSNDDIHFYFIASTIDSASRSKMMKRPLLESLYKRFQQIYNKYSHIAGEVFSKEVFASKQYERKVREII